MTRPFAWMLCPIFSALAIPASAHPGHGAPGSESLPSHYVTEPVHAVVLFAALAACGAVIGYLVTRRRRGSIHRSS